MATPDCRMAVAAKACSWRSNHSARPGNHSRRRQSAARSSDVAGRTVVGLDGFRPHRRRASPRRLPSSSQSDEGFFSSLARKVGLGNAHRGYHPLQPRQPPPPRQPSRSRRVQTARFPKTRRCAQDGYQDGHQDRYQAGRRPSAAETDGDRHRGRACPCRTRSRQQYGRRCPADRLGKLVRQPLLGREVKASAVRLNGTVGRTLPDKRQPKQPAAAMSSFCAFATCHLDKMPIVQ